MPQTAWVSWSPRQAEFSSSCSQISSSCRSWGQEAVVRASARRRAWALRTPVEQPSRMREKCWDNTEELGVNMWLSVPSPTHLSHITNINPFATLLRIKCERYSFLKKCVRSFIIFDYVSMYSCICIMWLYNTHINFWGWNIKTNSAADAETITVPQKSAFYRKENISKVKENLNQRVFI